MIVHKYIVKRHPKTKEWRWLAVARNGRPLFGSTESYKRRGACMDCLYAARSGNNAKVEFWEAK